jgi:hypothetical protein
MQPCRAVMTPYEKLVMRQLLWSCTGAGLARASLQTGIQSLARPPSTISGMRLVNVTPQTVALGLAVVTLLTLL